MNNYMTVETTNLIGCECYSLRCDDKDIQNGAIVGKGDLIEGETQVYKATEDYSNGMFLVAHPAWLYENYTTEYLNEENYINKKGVPFRVYELKLNKKYKVGNISADDEITKNNFVEFTKDGKYKKKDKGDAAMNLKVTAIEDVGFPYCIGSAGVKLTDDGDNKYGSALDMRNKKYTIEVVAKEVGE